jgi:hypothetical protein
MLRATTRTATLTAITTLALALAMSACGGDENNGNRGDELRVNNEDQCEAIDYPELVDSLDGRVQCCGDGVDNDHDGLVDSADPDCNLNMAGDEQNGLANTCADGIDNDYDGRVDCDDPDCFLAENCLQDNDSDTEGYDPEDNECNDGIDNDNDGLMDCDEPACFNDPVCTGDNGDNGGDDSNAEVTTTTEMHFVFHHPDCNTQAFPDSTVHVVSAAGQVNSWTVPSCYYSDFVLRIYDTDGDVGVWIESYAVQVKSSSVDLLWAFEPEARVYPNSPIGTYATSAGTYVGASHDSEQNWFFGIDN